MSELADAELGKAYDARLLRRLWQFVRPYRSVFWVALLLALVNMLLMLAQPWLMKRGINLVADVEPPPTPGSNGASPPDTAGLTRVGLWYAAALVGEWVSSYGQQYSTMVLAQRSLADLRVALFARLQRFPMAFFDKNPLGKVVSRLTTDVDVLTEMFAAGAMTIVLDGLKLVGIVAAMLWMNWRLALASLVLFPAVVFVVDFFRRASRRTYRDVRERIARINGYLQEAISGVEVLILTAREEVSYREFERLNADHRDATHLSNRLEAALFSVVEAISTVSIAAMLLQGAWLHADAIVEIGTLFAFIQLIQMFFVPIRDFSAKYAVLQSSMTAAERIFGLLDVETEPTPAAPRVPAEVRGEIVFEHVWFAYKDEDWVLRDVSFRIAPGEEIAIVGATGSGKTTLIKLLDRLYDVQRGRILVDGVDVKEWDPRALRSRIAVVLQDVFLFSGPLEQNIGMGRPDIDHARIQAAARHVNAERFIERLGGYQATLRERGSNLSGGQRQLLAFARALAHDPAILVLDEATSSVDPETEWLIQDALAKLLRNRTSVVIAHRLSTIESADRILVLHKGALREEGTHRALLEQGGIYAKLYRLQYAPAAPALLAAVAQP